MSKKPKFSVTIHMQANEMDVPKTMFPVMLEGKKIMFKILPEISQENVVAFHPFDSPSGVGKGITLQLETRGRGALEIATRTATGQLMLAMVNGKPVDYVVMDVPVSDGLYTIWGGVPPELIPEMEKKWQRIRAGGAPSMSDSMEMIPSNKKDRKRSKQEADKAAKEAEKARKSGKPVEPEIPTLQTAPASPKIPVEGGEAPANPAQALPQVNTAPPMAPPSLPAR